MFDFVRLLMLWLRPRPPLFAGLPSHPLTTKDRLSRSRTLKPLGTSVIDPKRKSSPWTNLLEQIGLTKAPVPSGQRVPFDQHSPDDETPITEFVQSKAAYHLLSPKLTHYCLDLTTRNLCVKTFHHASFKPHLYCRRRKAVEPQKRNTFKRGASYANNASIMPN
jgi:hypothetical protein